MYCQQVNRHTGVGGSRGQTFPDIDARLGDLIRSGDLDNAAK